MAKSSSRPRKKVPEIAVIGDVDAWEGETIKDLIEIPEGGECVFYVDSAGGSVYSALAVVTLIRLRRLKGTAIVLGECSSAALLLFAACQKRLVTPYSTFFFHRMRWQSEKRVAADEARLWARHFEQLEGDLDELQARLFGAGHDLVQKWIQTGSYLTGRDLAAAGLAELVEV